MTQVLAVYIYDKDFAQAHKKEREFHRRIPSDVTLMEGDTVLLWNPIWGGHEEVKCRLYDPALDLMIYVLDGPSRGPEDGQTKEEYREEITRYIAWLTTDAGFYEVSPEHGEP